MNLGYRGIAVLLIVGASVAVSAYYYGVRQGHQGSVRAAAEPEPEARPAGDPIPADHPPIGADAPPHAGIPEFSHFSIGNRNVKAMYADGDLIWIGTSGGVIRYDTRDDSYKSFDNTVAGILSNGVFHVSRLGERIAIGTYGGGLSLYDPAGDSWRNINIPDGLADQFVYEVLTAGNGDVWIATWSGVNRVRGGVLEDPSRWDIFTVENTGGGLPNPWVYGVEEGPDGTMWFATEGGLARYRDGEWGTWTHADGLGASYEAVRDTIQSTSDPGRASQHHAAQKAAQGLEGVDVAYNPDYIISLEVDAGGTVWCGTWGAGLARFDGKTWRNFTTADGLPANHIFMLYMDPQDRLWIGTRGGLARLNADQQSFTVMTAADGLYADNVFSMATAANGDLWIGSFGGVARVTVN